MNPSTPSSVNRRHFIHSAGAGGAVLLAQRAFAQSANETLNLAVIGTGAQGQELINNCMKIPGLRVAAICDIWESYNLNRASRILQGFQQEHNTYADYRKMLEAETSLDGVFVATPDAFHAEQTVACLDAGLPVYCEAMMANSVEGAKQIASAAKASGKPVQIGFQRRSNPYYRYCRDHIINETKLLGKLTACNSQWNRAALTSRGWPRRYPLDEATLSQYGFADMDQFRNWMWMPQFGGGPFAEFGSHQLDAIGWYLETAPRSALVSGSTVYYEDSVYQCPDTLMAVLDYETGKGVVRAFYQTINSNSNFGYFENFMGDEGTLYTSESTSRVKVYREPNAPDWQKWVNLNILKSPQAPAQEETKEEGGDDAIDIKESVIPPTYDVPVEPIESPFLAHIQNFVQAIKGEAALNCPPEAALPATIAVLRMNEAAQQSGKVEFSADDFAI